MGFSRQEYWSGLPFPSPGDLPDQKHLCFLLGPGSKVAPKGPFPPRTPIPFPSSLSFSHPLPQASISSSYPPPTISSFSFPSFLFFPFCFSPSSHHSLLSPCHALSPLVRSVHSLPLSQAFPSSLPGLSLLSLLSSINPPTTSSPPLRQNWQPGAPAGLDGAGLLGDHVFTDWLPLVARQLKYRPPGE